MKTKSFSFACALLLILSAKAQSNFIGSGISLSFNGSTNSLVSLGDVYNNLDFPFTVEAWLNLNEYSQYHSDILSSDNSPSRYYGLFFSVYSTGQLRIEFGDGTGAGSQFREGVETVSTVPLGRWIHVAAVCNSATDIQIYMNGVEQNVNPTDGTASIAHITHSSDGASIGWRQDPFGVFACDGQMDEIRLWNVARSEAQIRNNMCQKLSGTETGLIGYWIADESYTSNTVLDHTIPAENGTIIGTVDKITSGAPIGNTSVNLFTTSWKGISLTLSSPGKDKIAVKTVKNNPYGILLYRVDTIPYNTTGLNQYTNYYYGVFTVDNATAAKYNVSYHYSFKNGVVNSSNESLSSLFRRNDNSGLSWTNANASLNQNSNQLSLTKEDSRNEYIFNINNPNPEKELLSNNDANFSAYPNPFSNQLNIAWSGNGGEIYIVNSEGKTIYSGAIISTNFTLNTSSWADGIYLLMLKNKNLTYAKKIILNR